MTFPRRLFPAVSVLLLAVGCGQKSKPVTDLERKQAAHLASEAEFAVNLRDHARAEPLLEQAVALLPDNGSYWITLGSVRKRLGNRGGAKDAYEAALKAYERQARQNETDPDPWLKQIYVLALLGQVDEARARVEKVQQRFPTHRLVRIFIEEKQFDLMLKDPLFKETGL